LLEKRWLRIEPSEGPFDRVMIKPGAPLDSCGASEVRAQILKASTTAPGVLGHGCSIASGTDTQCVAAC
ncbi:MAG: hypothetical protein QOD34_3137, partial [Mycobacterium sp.]|nr:hypothetical protein [Mycobacterium sp.]